MMTVTLKKDFWGMKKGDVLGQSFNCPDNYAGIGFEVTQEFVEDTTDVFDINKSGEEI